MAKIKQQEGEYYEKLAGMVDEMTPEVIYQTVEDDPQTCYSSAPVC